ncbi:hypothetical protein [Bacillus cereus]|uniref:Uncharacterized protein n=1 Tax=Bacillus cereus TaxID=1396 RepID=A0A9X8IZ90_BACCE|nr:hypothetical protein [Bacillus cereus]RWQ73555.1 hypothetical protein DR116_0016055 [Bacillus cereus]
MFYNRVITMALPSLNAISYLEVYQLDQRYLGKVLTLSQEFQKSLNIEDFSFDFQKAIEITDFYDNTFVTNSINHTIKKEGVSVGKMIDTIYFAVNNLLELSEHNNIFRSRVLNTITNAFLNLSHQENESYFFYYEKNNNHTSYRYHIFLAIQENSENLFLKIVPISIDVTINSNIEEIRILNTHDIRDFTVNIKAINLVFYDIDNPNLLKDFNRS